MVIKYIVHNSSFQGVKVVLVGFFNINDLSNASKREEWVDSLLTKAIDGHADGINVDIEGPVSKGSKEVTLLNQLTADVYKTFKEKLPGSQVIIYNYFNIKLQR
jgi:hypothetical protein